RGYNLSGKPAGVSSYRAELLAGGVRDLIAGRSGAGGGGGGGGFGGGGVGRADGAVGAMRAGHDGGGAVAWATAMRHPESVRKLAILNVPHPRRMFEGLRTARQLRRSWYMVMFQLPGVSERLLRQHRFGALRRPFADA